MTAYFQSPERQAALLTECESWRGTRFWERASGCARKGVCADCVSFCVQVYVDLGAMSPVTWPPYVTHHGGAAMLGLLLEGLARIPRLAVVWSPDADGAVSDVLLSGDLVVVSSGKALHHLAIFAGGNVLWHCLAAEGVCPGNIHDPVIHKHIHSIHRFHEP